MLRWDNCPFLYNLHCSGNSQVDPGESCGASVYYHWGESVRMVRDNLIDKAELSALSM